MWKRNLLFAILTLAGLAAVAGNLLSGKRTARPEGYEPARYEQENFRGVVERIDRQFHNLWDSVGLTPTPRASDLTIARRLSLALTGTIPSLEEIRAFERVPKAQRLEWWLSHLLEDRRYADYVAERLARVFVGVEEGPFLVYRRRRFVTWLSDCLYQIDPEEGRKMPYDKLVRHLISDTGLWTGAPAVNFITATLDENNDTGPDEVTLVARVARGFLGVRIDCVQCHDDNLGGDWLQSDFHRLAAFFSDAQGSISGIRDGHDPYKFKYLDAKQAEIIEPGVPFHEDLLPQSGTRRQRLARWVTDAENKPFARAMVNRMWALLFGRPLVEPIDNVPLEGSFDDGTYPPGLEILSEDFAKHGFDLERLLRLIAATEAFGRDSRALQEITAEHEQNWASFPLTRLRAEQIAGAVSQTASLTTIDADSHIFVKLARYMEQNEFVERYGDRGEDEFASDGGTIPQRLLMLNGSLVKTKTEGDIFGNAATRIAALAPDDATAVETTYLVVLTRRPTAEEMAHFTGRLAGTQRPERDRRMEDFYWTLLNSTEFSWNH